MVSEPLPSLRWWERAQAQWGTPAGTLGPKRGWLWRPTSSRNENVLICINAQFMTQRILKPWWRWTYQNYTVKRASARAIPGWVTSWEVWFREQKTDNIVSLGVGRYSYHPKNPILCKQPTATIMIVQVGLSHTMSAPYGHKVCYRCPKERISILSCMVVIVRRNFTFVTFIITFQS